VHCIGITRDERVTAWYPAVRLESADLTGYATSQPAVNFHSSIPRLGTRSERCDSQPALSLQRRDFDLSLPRETDTSWQAH
jgi:hypothetical protein